MNFTHEYLKNIAKTILESLKDRASPDIVLIFKKISKKEDLEIYSCINQPNFHTYNSVRTKY